MSDKKDKKPHSDSMAWAVILAFVVWCLIPPSTKEESAGIKWFIYLSMLICSVGMVYFTFFDN